MLKKESLPKRQFDYKWVIAAICFMMVFVGLGFCSSAKSLYITAITEALGFSRSAFSINDSCRFISTAVTNVFFGTLVARFGTKRLIGMGFICLIISSLLYSYATNIVLFYVGGVFLGIGLAWTTTTMVGAIINAWFKENKGTVMGAVLASNGIGATVAIQITSPIIYREGDIFGYQDAYRLVALILFATFILTMIFYKEKPKNENEEIKANKKIRSEWEGIEYSEAAKKRYFYVMAVCIFLTGIVLHGISGIATPLLQDTGLDNAFVSTILSANVLALACFKFLVGFIYDKYGIRITSNICSITAVVVLFLLMFVTNSEIGRIMALIYGIFSALAMPLETIMLPIYAKELFGEKAYNKILGIFVSVSTAGYAIGAPIVNLCYDIVGTYKPAVCMGCILMIVITIGMNWSFSVSKKGK